MEWTLENCTNWTLGLLLALICLMNYQEYQKIAVAKTTRYRATLLFYSFVPILLISVPFLLLYHRLVTLLLSLRYGRKFAGLLTGQDMVFASSKGAIFHVVFLIEYDTSKSESFYEFASKSMRKTLLTKFSKCPKSFGIVEKFGGYLFLLRDEVDFNDCVKTLPIISSSTQEINLEDLEKLLGDYSDFPMPADNKGMWEVLIGTQPISHGKAGQNGRKKTYPVVLKANHCLADAMHMFEGIITMFSDDEEGENVSLRLQDVPTYSKGINLWTNKVRQYITHLRYILVIPAVVILNCVLQNTEPNLLHGPELTNKKIMCAVVDESQQYMQAMKRIKRKFSGCSFEDIFQAALSASLSDYCRKQSQQIPEYLVAEVPSAREACAKLQGLHKMEEHEFSCENDISANIRKIPTGIARGGNRQSVVDALEFIKRERVLLQECVEQELFYLLSYTMVQAVPYPLIELIIKETQFIALGITNVIGPPNFTVCGKCPVRDIIPFAANRNYAGITLSSFTYNNVWKLSLIVDRAIISKDEDVRTILNDIFKYILMLDRDS